MSTRLGLKARVRNLPGESFESVALAVFRYQAAENPVYRSYLHHRRIDPARVQTLEQIPFLPIEFFKTQRVVTGEVPPVLTFESSGTTGTLTSRHFVADPVFYEQISVQLFEQAYGPLTGYHVLALLPAYLERSGSSLVYMVRHFIERSASPHSGFFLHDVPRLLDTLRYLLTTPADRRVLLLGVTFALLDLAERGDWPEVPTEKLLVMETGGMKGRRRELLREEVHARLTRAFGVPAIHSEYGMTELLSQAYSMGEGIFRLPPTMRVLLRDVNDPFTPLGPGARTGGLNVIDLANVDSCAFIETKDLGNYGPQAGTFRVLGRFDNSDIRGCNLLVS
jgi:hypothetical protein